MLAALAIAYVLVLGGWGRGRAPSFDPLTARPHAIEQLIVARRFAEALPQIESLHASYPDEWLVSMWLARAHHALGHWRAEADAWESFARQSPAPQESCPWLPVAYERLGDDERALAAYERCTLFDRSDPGPFADLGAAYLRRGRANDAEMAYRAAAELAPDDPALRQQLAALTRAPSDPVATSVRQR